MKQKRIFAIIALMLITAVAPASAAEKKTHPHRTRNTAIGALAGFATGALIGKVSSQDDYVFSQNDKAAMAGAVGLVIGGAIGYFATPARVEEIGSSAITDAREKLALVASAQIPAAEPGSPPGFALR